MHPLRPRLANTLKYFNQSQKHVFWKSRKKHVFALSCAYQYFFVMVRGVIHFDEPLENYLQAVIYNPVVSSIV